MIFITVKLQEQACLGKRFKCMETGDAGILQNGKQSHVECFSYRFPDKGERVLKELPKRAGKPLYALFDYTDRDPLDHQAKVTWIMEDEDAGLCSH